MTQADELNKALKFDYAAMGWGDPKADEIPRLMHDGDFDSDFRNLLIAFRDADFDLAFFLSECESPRYIDLRRAYEILKALEANQYGGRDQLSQLAMEQSLCPVHFVDWAICFDDEPDDCSQVRAIFPCSHDT